MVERMPDANLPTPLYYQIKQIFDEKIKSGEWQTGQIIPSEIELIQKYNVSRTTIREGINALVKEGKLQKKQGKGTIVCSVRMEERLGKLTGFAEEMLAKGVKPGARLLEVRRMIPDKWIAEKLSLAEDDNVLYIKRIRLGNEEPIAIEHSYWPIEIGQLFMGKDLEKIAFYAELEQNGVFLKEADEIIAARNASREDAKLLLIKMNDPLLRMERITYSTNAQPIEFTCTDYRSDRYFYRVHLTR
ncbi:MAG TPA: GntR family transcriptional regulator [Bacilli bacterium]